MGRKSKYELNVKPHLSEIPKWYEEMTEAEIAKRLGVSVASFEVYKNNHPELLNVLHSAREELVDNLKLSLKKKALGFTYKETRKTIRNVDGVDTKVLEEYERYSPPDTGAIHLLLKNLDNTWRNDDKVTMDFKREKLELEKMKIESENW